MPDSNFTAFRVPTLKNEFEGAQRTFLVELLRDMAENFKKVNELINNSFATVTIVTDSPYVPLESDEDLFINTDSGNKIVNLAAGLDGQKLRIINAGTSGNVVTINPDGTENLLGENSAYAIDDSDFLIITFSITEGWY